MKGTIMYNKTNHIKKISMLAYEFLCPFVPYKPSSGITLSIAGNYIMTR